jgi:hypothetical protein
MIFEKHFQAYNFLAEAKHLKNIFYTLVKNLRSHNFQIFTEIFLEFFSEFFSEMCSFVGRIKGLKPTISKNREKSCFLYIEEISYNNFFSCKTEKNLHRFFGAASRQGFCKFFIKTQF